MIKWIAAAGAACAGFAFAAGCYVGWKTTLKAVEATRRHSDPNPKP